jgi:hypothetical protein
VRVVTRVPVEDEEEDEEELCPGLVRVLTGGAAAVGWLAVACPGLVLVLTGAAVATGWAAALWPGLVRVATTAPVAPAVPAATARWAPLTCERAGAAELPAG